MSSHSKSNKSEDRKYGFISIMALVVGSVIGAGIFFKNDAVNKTTQSGYISLLGWLIMASVVMMIAVAMLELFSAKSKHNVAGLTGLTSTFISPRFGKFIGFFFVYAYFPSSLAAISVYSGQLLLNAIGNTTPFIENNILSHGSHNNAWIELLVTTIIGLMIIICVGTLNSLTMKPGKIFQIFGTSMQLTTLGSIMFLVIASLVLTNFSGGSKPPEGLLSINEFAQPISSNSFRFTSKLPEAFKINSTINGGFHINNEGELVKYGLEKNGLGVTSTLILALPPIMFTFDGFLFASSLQNEAKSKKTFPIALVIGILILSSLYIFVALGTIETATQPPLFSPNSANVTQVNGNEYTLTSITGEKYQLLLNNYEYTYLTNAGNNQEIVLDVHYKWWDTNGVAGLFERLVPAASNWLPNTVAFIIVISTLTSISGFFISSARDMSILSSDDLIADVNGKYLRRNKAGIPQASSLIILVMTVSWLLLAKTLDAVFIADQLYGLTGIKVPPTSDINMSKATDFVADFVVVIAFVLYVLPLIGGVINRFTKKVEVSKNKTFIPFAIISSSITLFIVITNIINVFAGVANDLMELINVLLLIATIAVPAILAVRAGKKVEETTELEWQTKEFYKDAYFALKTVEEYEATLIVDQNNNQKQSKEGEKIEEPVNKTSEERNLKEILLSTGDGDEKNESTMETVMNKLFDSDEDEEVVDDKQNYFKNDDESTMDEVMGKLFSNDEDEEIDEKEIHFKNDDESTMDEVMDRLFSDDNNDDYIEEETENLVESYDYEEETENLNESYDYAEEEEEIEASNESYDYNDEELDGFDIFDEIIYDEVFDKKPIKKVSKPKTRKSTKVSKQPKKKPLKTTEKQNNKKVLVKKQNEKKLVEITKKEEKKNREKIVNKVAKINKASDEKKVKSINASNNKKSIDPQAKKANETNTKLLKIDNKQNIDIRNESINSDHDDIKPISNKANTNEKWHIPNKYQPIVNNHNRKIISKRPPISKRRRVVDINDPTTRMHLRKKIVVRINNQEYLWTLKKNELLALANEKGIEIKSWMNKNEIINQLKQDLSELRKTELINIAKSKNIDVNSRMNKNDLLNLLKYDLLTLSKEELMRIAELRNISVKSRMTKKELIDLIK